MEILEKKIKNKWFIITLWFAVVVLAFFIGYYAGYLDCHTSCQIMMQETACPDWVFK